MNMRQNNSTRRCSGNLLREWVKGSQSAFCIFKLLSLSLKGRHPWSEICACIHDLIFSDNTHSILTSKSPHFCNQDDIPINPVSQMKQSIIASFSGTLAKDSPRRFSSMIHTNDETCQSCQPNYIMSLLSFKVTLFYPWQLVLGSYLITNNKKDMQSL